MGRPGQEVTDGRDAWGRPLWVSGVRPERFVSAGPDRTFGTDDDIALDSDALAQGLALAAIPIGAACAGLIGLWCHVCRGPASRSPSPGVEVARAAWLAFGPTLVLWGATVALLQAWPVQVAWRSIVELLPPATGTLALFASSALLCGALALGWRLGRPLDEAR